MTSPRRIDRIALAGLLLLFPTSSLQAAEDAFAFYEEEARVVTVASRRSEDPLLAPGTVFVVTDKEIERYGWQDLWQILQGAFPNFEMFNHGTKVDGSMRGFSGTFDQIVFMINGRDFSEKRTNQAWIMDHSIPAARIKRVEVLEGPASTLYGSYAMQGVVNVVLKDEENDKDEGLVNFSYGQGNRQEYQGVFHKKTEEGEYGFDFSVFKAKNDFRQFAEFNADTFYSRNPSLDAVRDRGLNFDIERQGISSDGYARIHDFYAGYNYWRDDGMFGMDNPQFDFAANRALIWTLMPYAGWKHRFSDALDTKVEVQRLDNQQRFDFPVGPNSVSSAWHTGVYEVASNRTSYITQTNWKASSRLSLTGGVDYTQTEAGPGRFRELFPATRTDGSDDIQLQVDKDFIAVFGQADFQVVPDRLKLVYGYRFHKEDYTQTQNLHRASAIYTPWEGSAFKLTYGQGFRAPSFIELNNLASDARSKRSDPMFLESLELNYTQRGHRGDLRFENIAVLYDMRQKNRFQIVRLSGASDSFTFQVDNHRFEVYGFEDMLKVDYKNWSGYITGRVLHSDATATNAGDVVTVPSTRLKFGSSYNFTRHYAAGFWTDYFSDTHVPAPTLDGTAYEIYTVKGALVTTLNLRAGSFAFAQHELDFNLYINNLFDTRYYSPYPQGTRFAIVQFPRNIVFKASLKF